MATALRPLSLGELLDRTFFLLRNNFVLFSAIVALPSLPILALNLGSISAFRPPPSPTPQQLLMSLLVSFGVALALLVPALVVAALSQAATIIAVSRIQLDQPVSIASAFTAIRARAFHLAVMILVVGLLTGLGFVFFVVPGILLMLRLALVIPAAVLESLGLGEAMTRSAELTSGDRWRIFAIYVLYFILVAALGGLMRGVISLCLFMAGVSQNALVQPLWAQQLFVVGAFLVGAVGGPVLTIALSLVYYDERVRKEAFDVQHLLSQLPAVELVVTPG
jgi:hypothetical protein